MEDTAMKNDKQIQIDVIEELKWEPITADSEIGVAVKEGVVTLSGNVNSYAQKLAAERAAERVSGVLALADDLEVRLPMALERSDTDIAHAAVQALEWDSEVPETGVTLKVDDGWITLDGSVEWQYQRTAAERAVHYLMGVKGVSNLISVKPKHATPLEINKRITDALRRSAELDANQIDVEALDGKVVLRGKVRSWAERRDAERAAWAAPGVSRVEDRIMVSLL
jgi:osmotically-inducible protein OsmY